MMQTLIRIDQQKRPSAWPPQLEIPLAIDKTLEEALPEDNEYIVFTN